MDNYYRELNLAQTATDEEIRKAILRERRLWSNRTNSPDLERKQEAERKVTLLAQAEQILFDPVRKQQYDQALRMAPIEQPRAGQTGTGETRDWVREGRRLLSDGDIPNALFAATQATTVDGANPEAWALSAQAKFRWGQIQDSVYEYKRAISLRPNEATYYFDLGGVYESVEEWNSALQNYQWASRIEPMTIAYRASVGEAYFHLDHYEEAITVLKQCVAEDQNNFIYKNYLALAYCAAAYEHWTLIGPNHPQGVPPGHYATTKLQIDEALAYVQKAQELQLQDPEVRDLVNEIHSDVQSMLKRHFHGNWFAPPAALFLGLLFLSGSAFWGLLYLACSVGYIVSCFIPQYIVNRRIIAGQELSSNRFLVSVFVEGGVGCGGMIFGMLLITLTLPVVTTVNILRNWVLAPQPTAAEKQRLARMQPQMVQQPAPPQYQQPVQQYQSQPLPPPQYQQQPVPPQYQSQPLPPPPQYQQPVPQYQSQPLPPPQDQQPVPQTTPEIVIEQRQNP